MNYSSMMQWKCQMEVKEARGYNLHWVEDPPDDLKCLICLCVARDPQQHPGDAKNQCGKIFCLECITKYQKHQATCPNCRQNLTFFPDAKSARQISSLKVKCGNETNGCNWMGELSSLETHLQSCDYAVVPCTNKCVANMASTVTKLLRKDLANHLAYSCSKLQYECPHCGEMGEYQEITTVHLEICPQRYKLELCKYAPFGCKKKLQGKDLKKHEEDDSLHIQAMRKKFFGRSQVVMRLQAKTKSKANVQPPDSIKKADEWVSCVTTITRTLRLCNYQKRKLSNDIFCSPPFYTFRRGYKIRMLVLANGDGRGVGTHVSVYACLMKGDHDDTLTWPFTGSVKIEILNQLEDKNHYRGTITFKADKKASMRVVDREIGENWGKPFFISHTALNYDPRIKDTQYLRDDTLVFRFTTSVSHLLEHTQ